MNVDAAAPTPRDFPARRRRDPFVVLLVIAIGLATMAAGAWSFGAFAADDAPGLLATRRDPLLPDLAMGPIEDIAVGTTENGDQRLRFSATIVNIGEGPLIVRARRAWLGNEDWSVDQWVQERSGGYSMTATGASLTYGGDGHGHWHVKQVEIHQLESMDGKVLGRLVKQGFCFFDTDVYRPGIAGAPEGAHWGSRGCASNLDTRVRMGLSVGWGDKYPWSLLDERIDVSGLPDGRFRIRQIADPNDEFEEADETNNDIWVDVALATLPDGLREVKVVEAGPAP